MHYKVSNLVPYSVKKTDIELNELLNLFLSEDFKYINTRYDYEFLEYFEMYSFTVGVVAETKSWRESINLPLNYLVLGDNGTSALLMKIENDNANVIHCALEDVLNLCAGRPMEYDPIIFETFADFFEFLLDEEEELRAEDPELYAKLAKPRNDE